MNATGVLITISGLNLAAVLSLGLFLVQLGRGLQRRDDTLAEHGRRLDVVEPKISKLRRECDRCLGHTTLELT